MKEKEVIEELEKHERFVAGWIGSMLGKLDRSRKEQKHHFLIVMLLQIITLIVIVLKTL